MKNVSRFEKWQVVLMLGMLIGAWYFGFYQKDVSDKLEKIEQYRYKKEKMAESSKNLEDKNQLRKLTIQIIDYYTWGAGMRKEQEIKDRTSEDKVKISKEIQFLLDQGLDNDLLKSDKKALMNWLDAYNMTEGILNSPSPLDEVDKKYIDGAFSKIFDDISAVHSDLKLSYALIRQEIQKELESKK